ncbi:ribonuclease-like 3 [Boleophthalmus pectinirostris]|uniref:ribonuclease-like 3 n=1 Tax=Boleophthalmus pectinirostris TaxID=150288 RepID=UPI000A1C3452|nr:ribonuclease-like 3 [Boleophthalmus pectinirostris]
MRTYFLFLLVLFPSALLGQNDNYRYKKFINQHVKQGMSRTRCDAVMGDRRITETNSNECKETNTFIDAGTNEINRVCNRAGAPYQNSARLRVSNQPFPLVICSRRRNKYYPHCQYRGSSTTRYIVIECENGFPVHFERDVYVVNNG